MKYWLIAASAALLVRTARADENVGDRYKATGYETVYDDYDRRLERACYRLPEVEEQAKLPEYPATRTLLAAGLSVPAFGGARGYGNGAHVYGERQWHLADHPRLFLRATAEPMWTGRFGAIGEAAVGVTLHHEYGTYYRGARDYLVTTPTPTDYGAIETTETNTTPVHVPAICTVAAWDIHLFTGIRAGVWAGRDLGVDPTTGQDVQAPTDHLLALEGGLTNIKRAADGSWREETVALLYDPTLGGFGAFLRVAQSFHGWFAAGDMTLYSASGDRSIFLVTADWGKRWE